MLGLVQVGDTVEQGIIVAVSDDGCWCEVQTPNGDIIVLPVSELKPA